MEIESGITPLLGISYRPYKKKLVDYMKSKGHSTQPYLQIYCYFFVITFRPFWTHINNGEKYCVYYSGLNRKLIRKWGTV